MDVVVNVEEEDLLGGRDGVGMLGIRRLLEHDFIHRKGESKYKQSWSGHI